MTPEEIKIMIDEAFPGDAVEVEGDGHHFSALIVSERFEGLGLVQRHQIVYTALGDNMRERIHALSLKTLTPKQWEETK